MAKRKRNKEVMALALGDEDTNTVGFTVAKFPAASFIEWDKDCIKNWNNRRWMKMWNDHQLAKVAVTVGELTSRIEALEEAVADLINQKRRDENRQIVLAKEPKKDVVKTFGGDVDG